MSAGVLAVSYNGGCGEREMVKYLILAVALVVLGTSASAHDIITTNLTYTRDISRILAQRCQACHTASASIPLTNYEEVRPWAVGIKEQVLSRSMPPWGAVKGFGNLQPDRALTQEEIMIVAAWVIGGAPKGDAGLLPKLLNTPSPPMVPLHDSLIVTTKALLAEPLSLAALRPLTTQPVNSARITAHLPNGRIEPLLWLSHYQPGGEETFRLREPLDLPAGSTVESSAPLRFSLESERR